MYNFDGYNIPDNTRGALERYINHGIEPGGFLMAVLSNNLIKAIGSADHHNLAALKDICGWLYMYAPSNCWGSFETVDLYIRMKRNSSAQEE